MSIANSWGHRKLDKTPLRFTLAGRVLTEVTTVLVLRVDFSASGSASPWLRSVPKSASTMLHLFRRIAQRSGGTRTRITRKLVCSVLQPRLIYQAQFQRLTKAEWARLENLNREAMRVITGLPRLPPITTLQAETHFNTLDELIHQRREARAIKHRSVPAAAALANYMDSSFPSVDQSSSPLARWSHCQVTNNKPLGCIRQMANRKSVSTTAPVTSCSEFQEPEISSYVDD